VRSVININLIICKQKNCSDTQSSSKSSEYVTKSYMLKYTGNMVMVSKISRLTTESGILLTGRWDWLQVSKCRQAKAESFTAERRRSYQCNHYNMPMKMTQPENWGGSNTVAFTHGKSFSFCDDKFIHIEKYNYLKKTYDDGVSCKIFSNSRFSFSPYCKCAYALHCFSDSKTTCPVQSVYSISGCHTLFCSPDFMIICNKQSS
jgi:hypothetical protein